MSIDGRCDLCGLPPGPAAVTDTYGDQSFRFCCMGCRQVFGMLFARSGTADPSAFKNSDLFRKCREMGIIPATESDLKQIKPVALGPDSPPDLSPPSETVPENSLKTFLIVKGMWCPSCGWVIREALRKRAGVSEAGCDFSTDRAHCRYDPRVTSPRQLAEFLGSLGYPATVEGEQPRRGVYSEPIRLGASLFLTLNVMMLSYALYSGFFQDLTSDTVHKLSIPIFFMATVVLFYGGRPIYMKAWAGIRSTAFGMETLISLGAFSAYAYSSYNLTMGSLHLYYDTVCMLITLVLLGKSLEGRVKARVGKELGSFLSLRPAKANICTRAFPGGRYAAVEQLREGDLFRVRADETVPADGVIVQGSGMVDMASLTGEPIPKAVDPGETIHSGVRVIDGDVKVRATAVGDTATLGRMIAIMERALATKVPLENATDRILQWFVPGVAVLAAGTGLICLLGGLSVHTAVIRAVTVLVISCPCALGVAIPLARVAGIHAAGKKGILVKDFGAFQTAVRADTFVFDKTGTVTHGRWILLKTICLGTFTEARVLSMAADLETASDHPVSRVIRAAAAQRKCPGAGTPRAVTVMRNGLSGRVGNLRVKIGSRGFLADDFASADPTGWARGVSPDRSLVYMSVDGLPAAVFVFGDRVRENARETVAELHRMGHDVSLVSGDGDTATRIIGERLNIRETRGGRMPRDKAEYVGSLQRKGRTVAMVGDGINDGPALALADLGVAVYSGRHLGKEAADITLMRPHLPLVPEFVALSEQVTRKIRQNLTFSFLYNLISIPFAMSGLLNPLVAVTAMLLSSLCVIGNTAWLVRKSSP